MSNRSGLEFNHDHLPHSFLDCVAWVDQLLGYLNTGDKTLLPKGVTYFYQRHHSDPCPLGEPPKGWNNNK